MMVYDIVSPRLAIEKEDQDDGEALRIRIARDRASTFYSPVFVPSYVCNLVRIRYSIMLYDR